MVKGVLLTSKTNKGRQILGKLGLDTTKTPSSAVSSKIKLDINELTSNMLDVGIDQEACIFRVKLQYKIDNNCKMTAKIKNIGREVFCYLE